jgi:antitoxin MazE
MVVKIKKWGNGHGVLLPKVVLQTLGFKENEELDFSFVDNRLVLEKKKSGNIKEYTLEDLLKEPGKKGFRKKLLDWGPDVGKEIWEY